MLRTLGILTVLVLLPMWFYVSGNIPHFGQRPQDTIKKDAILFPMLPSSTQESSHGMPDEVEEMDIEIQKPQTEKLNQNERQFEDIKRKTQIIELRHQIHEICRSIVNDGAEKKIAND